MAISNKGQYFKLLFITTEFGKEVDGGVGRVINGICSHFPNIGQLDVLLLEFNFSICDWDAILYKGENNFSSSTCHHYYIKSLIEIIRIEKYDMVHLFHTGEPHANCLRAVKEQFPDIMTIYSCHSIFKYEFNIRKTYPANLSLENYILENVDYIHALNDFSARLFKKYYPQIVINKPIYIIPNGINTDFLNKVDVRQQRKYIKKFKVSEKIIVLCMSRWSYGKGLEQLLDAARLVIKERKNIIFVIAGKKTRSWENGYSAYIEQITQKIKSLKGYVFPLGWLNDIKRNAAISIADIWVMPSLLEYFPYSILEPMAGRLPIISSRIDPVTEILTDDFDGLLYAPEKPDDLAGKIIFLADNEEKRKELSVNAYEKVIKKYSWKIITPMYLNMYYSILSGKNKDTFNQYEGKQSND
jgi:glycosyltransferase involved in cell wall biosynthesis